MPVDIVENQKLRQLKLLLPALLTAEALVDLRPDLDLTDAPLPSAASPVLDELCLEE